MSTKEDLGAACRQRQPRRTRRDQPLLADEKPAYFFSPTERPAMSYNSWCRFAKLHIRKKVNVFHNTEFAASPLHTCLLVTFIFSLTLPNTVKALIFAEEFDPPTAESGLAGVGLLQSNVGSCTATPITRTAIITAAHCTPDSGGSRFYFDVANDGTWDGYRTVSGFVDHPDWNNSGGKTRDLIEFRADIAIAFLDSALPVSVPHYRLWTPPFVPVGAAVYLGGYGRQGVAGNVRSNTRDGRLDRRLGTNVIRNSLFDERIFQVKFDNKPFVTYLEPCTGKACGATPTTPDSFFREGSNQPGDSGSAYFIRPSMDFEYSGAADRLPPGTTVKLLSSEYFIAGVHSHGPANNTNYGYVSGAVSVASYLPWIQSQVALDSTQTTLDTTLYSAAPPIDFGVTVASYNDPRYDPKNFVYEKGPGYAFDLNDLDYDDDGIPDDQEDANRNGHLDAGETDPTKFDTDGDGVSDGVELGRTTFTEDPDGPGPMRGTDLAVFLLDADPTTTSNPTDPDSDGDGFLDGEEDTNANGKVDAGETDPSNMASQPVGKSSTVLKTILILKSLESKTNQD